MAEKAKRIKLKDRTSENDIKFKPFISYRYLRIAGWIFLALAQLGVIFKLEVKLDPSHAATFGGWINFCSVISSLPLPCFLLANFAIILQNKKSFKSLFIKFGGMALAMYAVGNLVVLHFVYGLIHSLDSTTTIHDATKLFGVLLSYMGQGGYIFNIFIDLFLFCLVFYFMNYNPKRVFVGKKIIIFRLFVILPLLYEVGSLVVKGMISLNYISVPSYFFFLLTSKPPMMFVVFFVLVIAMKIVEYKQFKKHGSLEKLQDYLTTNAHQVRVSIGLSFIILGAVILDIIAAILVIIFYALAHANNMDEIDGSYIINLSNTLGFGSSVVLIFMIPAVLCFSYTKAHENKKIDTLIPIAGLALIILIYAEGFFQVITHNISRLIEIIGNRLAEVASGEEEPANGGASSLAEAVRVVKNAIARIYF